MTEQLKGALKPGETLSGKSTDLTRSRAAKLEVLASYGRPVDPLDTTTNALTRVLDRYDLDQVVKLAKPDPRGPGCFKTETPTQVQNNRRSA